MKKKILIIVVSIIVIIGIIAIMCLPRKINKQPELSQIRAICNLATLKTYYHNVAKLEKNKDWILQKDRELWIEYTGITTIGIDMSKVEMKVENEKVTVTLPMAKLLSIDIDENKIDKKSYVYSQDNILFKNEITAKDETEAIKQAQSNMKKEVEENQQLLKIAQERAKDLIERYIKQLGELSGNTYKIEWNLLAEQ